MAVDLDDLLLKTSRTFALAIPLLPQPTRRSISLAYLMFRIADTFEDAEAWPPQQRITALRDLAGMLQARSSPSVFAEAVPRWTSPPPSSHAGYLELLRQTPAVVGQVATLVPAIRNILILHTVRTAEGMARIIEGAGADGSLHLASMAELKAYCYTVAGIVGELLTDCFLYDAPQLRAVEPTLRRHMAAFGEALQLVNILKDAADDAREGRSYLPPGVAFAEVVALARQDLDQAFAYVAALQKGHAPRGIVAFTVLPARLAQQALTAIEERGPGAKVPRTQVAQLMVQLQADLAAGRNLLAPGKGAGAAPPSADFAT